MQHFACVGRFAYHLSGYITHYSLFTSSAQLNGFTIHYSLRVLNRADLFPVCGA